MLSCWMRTATLAAPWELGRLSDFLGYELGCCACLCGGPLGISQEQGGLAELLFLDFLGAAAARRPICLG